MTLGLLGEQPLCGHCAYPLSYRYGSCFYSLWVFVASRRGNAESHGNCISKNWQAFSKVAVSSSHGRGLCFSIQYMPPVFDICLLNYDHDGRCEMVSHCGDAKNY